MPKSGPHCLRLLARTRHRILATVCCQLNYRVMPIDLSCRGACWVVRALQLLPSISPRCDIATYTHIRRLSFHVFFSLSLRHPSLMHPIQLRTSSAVIIRNACDKAECGDDLLTYEGDAARFFTRELFGAFAIPPQCSPCTTSIAP